jgi:hypothetical protein
LGTFHSQKHLDSWRILEVATADGTTITIWEVGFISGGTPTEVETLPAPETITGIFCINHSPEEYSILPHPMPYCPQL